MLALGVSLMTAVPVFALATGHIANNDLGVQVIGMAKTKCVQKVTITNPGGAGNLDIDSFAVTNTGTAGDAAGTYSVDVNGVTGSFTVKAAVPVPVPAPAPAPAPVPTPPAEINWPIIWGVIAGVVVLGLIIFLLARRRRY